MACKELTLVAYKCDNAKNYIEAKKAKNVFEVAENLTFEQLKTSYETSLNLEHELNENSLCFVVLCGSRFLEVKLLYKLLSDYGTFYSYYQRYSEKDI
jgi:hypothetical protein